jgi:hypothetical protein
VTLGLRQGLAVVTLAALVGCGVAGATNGSRVVSATLTRASAGDPTQLALLQNSGFVRAYEADYDPPSVESTVDSTPNRVGPQTITSEASIYKSANGAEASFAQSDASIRAAPSQAMPLNGTTIGNEAVLYKYRVQYGGNPPPGLKTETYCVTWRRLNLKATVCLNADSGGLSPADAVALVKSLAAHQDSRM